ncbi:type 4 pilus major pilin [Xanthomonas euvesicatoria]
MKNYTRRHTLQRGMTLIEMMVVLALIGLLVAGALVASAKGWFGNKVTSDIKQLSSLMAETKKLQGVDGYGTSGTNLVPTLIANGGVPADMTKSGSTILNKFGGTVTIVSTGLGYTVTSPGYETDACMEVSRALSTAGSGLTTRINGGTATTGQISAASATTSCSSDSNSLAFTFAN